MRSFLMHVLFENCYTKSTVFFWSFDILYYALGFNTVSSGIVDIRIISIYFCVTRKSNVFLYIFGLHLHFPLQAAPYKIFMDEITLRKRRLFLSTCMFNALVISSRLMSLKGSTPLKRLNSGRNVFNTPPLLYIITNTIYHRYCSK